MNQGYGEGSSSCVVFIMQKKVICDLALGVCLKKWRGIWILCILKKNYQKNGDGWLDIRVRKRWTSKVKK